MEGRKLSADVFAPDTAVFFALPNEEMTGLHGERSDCNRSIAERPKTVARGGHLVPAIVAILRSATLSVFLIFGVCVAKTSAQPQSSDFLVAADSVWRYKAGAPGLLSNWTKLDYDDSHWRKGKASFGYGDDDERTGLHNMRGEYSVLTIRHRFEISRTEDLKKLYLYIRFDDAFIAYLNGKEVARSHVVDTWFGRNIESHEASKFERFSIHEAIETLRAGRNVLTVVGFNRSLDSSDFLLHPVLTSRRQKNPGLSLSVTAKEMQADVDHLQWRLEDQSSYLSLRDEFNHKKALDEVRQSITAGTTPIAFARNLAKLVAQIGDAHAEVKVWLNESTDRFLPFRLADTNSGIVALSAEGDELLNPDFPRIRAIDSKPIDHWMRVAARYVSQASPQLIRRESLRELRSIDRIRDEMSLPASPRLTVTLESADGKTDIEMQLETSGKQLPSGKVPLGDTRILDDNIGYLRIPTMSVQGTEAVLAGMAAFRKTDGLIIDVRGNRGGYYPTLQALYGYFLGESAPPYVANIAAYRLSPRFKHDHLADRPTFRASYSGWSAAEKTAIAAALDRFKPEWPLPTDQFSDWHFMVLGKTNDRRQYHYRQPVAVLADAASYSATDGFLSAFADLPGVAIIGGPSAGGSGATESFVLPNSGIQVALSSMASYRPNGGLYDGNGIQPDIYLVPTVDDFLGNSDTVLQRAVQWIRNSTN